MIGVQMRFVSFLWLVWMMSYAQSDIEHFTLNGQDFAVVTETYDLYETKGRVAKFYKNDAVDERNLELVVTLEEKSGGCGARSIEYGTYRIRNDRLVVYTQWRREPKARFAPVGFRKQIYTADLNGSLRRIEGEIYIETGRPDEADEGMRYLFAKKLDAAQKKALAHYIRSVRKTYGAAFVSTPSQKETLDREVREALHHTRIKHWR
jgi:hypothetical protein